MARGMTIAQTVPVRAYVGTMLDVMSRPGEFFRNAPEGTIVRPAAILAISALIHTGACWAMYPAARLWTSAGILFINAAFTPLIAALIGYAVMRATLGEKTEFIRFFGIYAYASAAILLAAWMPYSFWITEPWRWWLIGTGLVRRCGLSRGAAAGIVFTTIVLLVLTFKLLMHLSA